MIVARLLDLEGRTVCEVAVPGDEWTGMAPPLIRVPAIGKPTLKEDDDPTQIEMKTIVYLFERITGDGIYIYRRETGPWG